MKPQPYHLRGVDALTVARVQTDVYAADASGVDAYAVAEAVADAVDGALSGIKGDLGTPPGRHVAGAFRISRRAQFETGSRARSADPAGLQHRDVHRSTGRGRAMGDTATPRATAPGDVTDTVTMPGKRSSATAHKC